jgi:Carboxypeptidase regulatory-like domain/PASTA domain
VQGHPYLTRKALYMVASPTQVAAERDNAAREFGEVATRLRTERGDSVKKLRAAEQQIASLRLDNARLADRLALLAPEIVMPTLVGMNVGQASKALSRLQLTQVQITPESAAASEGTVLRQWPPANAKVTRGVVTALVVSSGGKQASGESIAARTSTDANGYFARKVQPGTYDVRFQSKGFGTVIFQGVRVTPIAGARLEVSIPLATEAQTLVTKGFYPGRAAAIEGIVRDPAGAPVPRVNVSVIRR